MTRSCAVPPYCTINISFPWLRPRARTSGYGCVSRVSPARRQSYPSWRHRCAFHQTEVVWDAEIPGFGVRVWPSGRRVYILKYRNLQGRQRKPVIGRHGNLTADQARSVARQWLAEVERGNDPASDKLEARRGATVRELCGRFLSDYAEGRKKESSIRVDRRMIRG